MNYELLIEVLLKCIFVVCSEEARIVLKADVMNVKKNHYFLGVYLTCRIRFLLQQYVVTD